MFPVLKYEFCERMEKLMVEQPWSVENFNYIGQNLCQNVPLNNWM